jgi:hypothetical protein
MKKIIFLIPIIVVFIIFFIFSKKYKPITIQTYENSRYGFSINYPDDWSLGKAPENNDGREFISSDEQIICRAYGFANALQNEQGEPQTLEEFIDWLYDDPQYLLEGSGTIMAKRQAYETLSRDEGDPYRQATYILGPEIGYGVYCLYPSLDVKENSQNNYQLLVDSFSLKNPETFQSGQNICSNLLSGVITPLKDIQTFLDKSYPQVTLTSREYWDQNKLPQQVIDLENQDYTCYPMPFEMETEESKTGISAQPAVRTVQWDCELEYQNYQYLKAEDDKKSDLETQGYECKQQTCSDKNQQETYVWLCAK